MIRRRLRPTPRLRTSSSSWRWRSIHTTLSWSRSSTNVIRESSCNIQGRRDAERGAAEERLNTKHVSKQEVVPRVAPAGLAAAESDPSLPDDERRPNGETASGTTRVGGPPQTVFSLRFNSFFYKGSHQELRRRMRSRGGGEANKQNKRNLASATAELRNLQAAADTGEK